MGERMTLEELQLQFDELKAEKEAVNSKNKELLGELKKVKMQNKEVDIEKYLQMQDDLDTLKTEHEKLLKTSKIESEKLSTSLKAKDDALRNHLIEEGLTSNLAKAGVKPGFLNGAKALLRQNTLIKEENGAYQALLGDKPLSDGIAEWISGEEGKEYIQSTKSSGGGASGSNGGNNDLRKYFDKTSPDFSLTKQAEVYQSNPQLFEQLKG